MVSEIRSFTSAATIGSLECVDIMILNDTNVECHDVFTVTLNTSDSNVVIAEGYEVATVTIELDLADCEFVLVLK